MKKNFLRFCVLTALVVAFALMATAQGDTLDPWDAVPDVPRVCCFHLNGKPLSDYVTMKTVSSSMFSEVGYVPEVNHLYVRFSSGSVYLYTNLTEKYYNGLASASSMGNYFNDTIKGNFPCFRIYE